MVNLHATDELTSEERSELELAFDGPIPPQAIADKIRMRPTRDVAYLEKRIAEMFSVCQMFGADLSDARASGNQGSVDYWSNVLAGSTRKLQALRDELATHQMKQAAE